ncbi:MAG TPA: N-acetyltransferase [Vulgatibacter sp.]|nr:N-acetyltransferase [Vulgatibacter sp.]
MATTLQPPTLSATADVTVRPVESPRDLDRFVRLPAELHAGDPTFVPPLLMERKDFLDPRKNPFFDHAPHQLFLAWQRDRVVGRVAAVEDLDYNRFHGTDYGFFGMYEAVDDDDVARALFAAAKGWIRARGRKQLMGPMNLSTNHDFGLLIEGFEHPPAIMVPHNPRYYQRHFEELFGLRKAKDLWGWLLDPGSEPDPKVVRIAERVRRKEGLVVRPVNLSDFDAEVRRIKEIYNAAWEKNWGFVPFTDAEFAHVAKDMRSFVRPELLLIAEVREEPVAFVMTLPDINQALARVGGRLTTFGLPIGLAKLLWWSRKIDNLRLITLGVKEPYRKRGIDALLYIDSLAAARKLGFKSCDISWILEDNVLTNRSIQLMGGKRYKTFRVYEDEVGE